MSNSNKSQGMSIKEWKLSYRRLLNPDKKIALEKITKNRDELIIEIRALGHLSMEQAAKRVDNLIQWAKDNIDDGLIRPKSSTPRTKSSLSMTEDAVTSSDQYYVYTIHNGKMVQLIQTPSRTLAESMAEGSSANTGQKIILFKNKEMIKKYEARKNN